MEPMFVDQSNFMNEIKNNVPRLAPLWHDYTVQELIRNKNCTRFAKDNLPDFGGFGVDVAVEGNIPKCKEIKHVTDCCKYAADTCSLPFLPANKVADLEDPCLETVITMKEKFTNFCSRLELSRRNFKNEKKGIFRNEVLLAHKILKIMSLRNKFEKTVLHKQLLDLAFELPEKTVIHPINFSYIGGCLATTRREDKNDIILHPTGEKLNRLGLTILEEVNDLTKYFKPVSVDKSIIKLKGGHILQIDSEIDGYCYIRQKQSCHFVDFSDLAQISQYRCIKNEELLNIAASPYNPLDYIAIYKNGMLKINNIETGKSSWNLDKSMYSHLCTEINSVQCGFGSHPQSILCLNEKCLYSFDTRLKENQCCRIFSCEFPSCFYNEHLINLKNCAVSPFQHVISSNNHLFVCDERYPNRPVLSYNHMLRGYPLYCDSTTIHTEKDTSDVLVILGTQNRNTELSAFSIRAQHALVQPISLSPPMHLSSPSDSAESLKLHCIPIDDSLVKRLSYPLIGISILPHAQNIGYTTFQLNSLGDLFFQDFKQSLDAHVEKSHRVYTGCVLTPPDKIQLHLSEFMSHIEEAEDYLDLIHPYCTSLNVDLTDIFDVLKNRSESCDICNFNNKEVTLTNLERDQTITCSTCGLSGAQSANLNNAFSNLTLLVGSLEQQSTFEEFDVSKFHEFTDPFSKKILDAWDDHDNDIKVELLEDDANCSSSFDTSTPISYYSPASSSATIDSDNNFPFGTQSKEDICKKLFEKLSAVKSTLNELTSREELFDDFVPPSQEIRPLVGETLRKLKKPKSSLNKSGRFSAGF